MNATQVEDRNGKLGEYLGHLRSMALELERSMEAVAQNSLLPLEDSIANQQALAARLSELAADLRKPKDVEPASTIPDDSELMLQIRGAADRLQSLNRCYAALLRHSSHSAALMASLFRSFTGQMREQPDAVGLTRQTWSWEG